MRLALRACGRADADEAWDRYARPERWSQWSPQVRAVSTSARRLRPGLEGVVLGSLGVRVSFVVLAVDERDARRRSWVWTVRLERPRVPGAHLRLEHDVVPGSTQGCRTGLVLDGPAPVVLGYAPAARLALARLVRP